jgi:15-cis-phytoene desaturase
MRVFAQLIVHDRYCFGFAGGALDELFWPAAQRVLDESRCELRLDCAASALTCESHRCTGALLSDGSSIHATHCVSCLPAAELLDVLPPAWAREDTFRRIRAFMASPYMSVYHWLDRKITTHRFWTQTWNPAHLNCDFYDLSNIRPDWAERPSVIGSNIIHSVGLDDLSDDDISKRTLEEIARFAPGVVHARVSHRRIHRIPMAIPCPRPGTESIRPRTETAIPGLLLAGDWTGTSLPVCMESAARSGFLAAEQVLAQTGRARSIAKMPAPPPGSRASFLACVPRAADERHAASACVSAAAAVATTWRFGADLPTGRYRTGATTRAHEPASRSGPAWQDDHSDVLRPIWPRLIPPLQRICSGAGVGRISWPSGLLDLTHLRR